MSTISKRYRINFPLGYAEESEQRLTKLKKYLVQIQAEISKNDSDFFEFLSKEIRASACVAASGELERYFREVLRFLYQSLVDESVSLKDVQPGLRVIGSTDYFQKIIDQDLGIKNWELRHKIVSLHEVQDRFVYKPSSKKPIQPLDGKTLKKEHISTIIQALNLNFQPSAKQLSSITAISSIRNDVAHVNSPIDEVFHLDNLEKSIDSVVEHLDNIIEFIIELSYDINEYYYLKKYLV